MAQPKPQQQAQTLWKTTVDALLTSDEVDALYVRLEGLAVALDNDPLAYGPKRLQEKTAQCRAHLTTVERMFLDVSRRLHALRRDLRAKKSALELATKFLYAEDPEVRAGRNIADRDAFAAIKLKPEWMAVHTGEQVVGDLEAVMHVIKAKRSDLRDTQGRIRDQVRLCGQELELGGRWGTKRPNAPDLEPGQGVATGEDVQDVLDLIEDVGGAAGEIHLPPLTDDTDEPELDEEAEAPAAAAEEAEVPAAVAEETPAETPWSNPTEVDLDGLDDEPAPAEEPPAPDTTLPEPDESAKNAAEVLPGNGASGAEIDRLINQVQLPTATASKGEGITNQNIDDLLEMFE